MKTSGGTAGDVMGLGVPTVSAYLLKLSFQYFLRNVYIGYLMGRGGHVGGPLASAGPAGTCGAISARTCVATSLLCRWGVRRGVAGMVWYDMVCRVVSCRVVPCRVVSCSVCYGVPCCVV